jgi:hypothetical protein
LLVAAHTPQRGRDLHSKSSNKKLLCQFTPQRTTPFFFLPLLIVGLWSFLVQSNQPKGYSLAENWSMALP